VVVALVVRVIQITQLQEQLTLAVEVEVQVTHIQVTHIKLVDQVVQV
jgi:hypothetical protein